MIYYFKKVLMFSVALLCIYSFPIQGYAQNPDTATLQEVKPLSKSEIKFKGWYFGPEVGYANSIFQYEIPEDFRTGLTGTRSSFMFKSYFKGSIGNGIILQLNAKYVANKWFRLDFMHHIKEDGGDITLYREYSTGWFTSGYTPVKIYNLKLITSHLTITPNLTFGSPKFNFFAGVGIGITNVLHRSGNLDKDLTFKVITPLYRFNMGFSGMLRGGLATLNFAANRTGNMGFADWKGKIAYFSGTVGYALPISAFKKKTKTATL